MLPRYVATMPMPKLILIAALSITACLSLPKKIAAEHTHVLIISVDGLRPDALNEPLLSLLPAFNRLLRGPHTLDARTDANCPTYTDGNRIAYCHPGARTSGTSGSRGSIH